MLFYDSQPQVQLLSAELLYMSFFLSLLQKRLVASKQRTLIIYFYV